VYSRIRKLDSDAMRAERQRKVIMAILDAARDASPRQILGAISACLRYVRTDFPKDRIDNIARDAIAQGWLNYQLVQHHSPTIELEEPHPTGFATHINGRFLWIVDYPRDAQRLQQNIYGLTNIELDEGRDDFLAALFRKLKGDSGDGAGYSRPPSYEEQEETSPPEEYTSGEEEATTQRPLFPWIPTRPQATEPPVTEPENIVTEPAADVPVTEEE